MDKFYKGDLKWSPNFFDMQRLLKKIKKEIDKIPNRTELFEKIMLKKFGGYKNAQKKIIEMQKSSKDEIEFENKIKEIMHFEIYEKLWYLLSKQNSLIKLIRFIKSLKNGKFRNYFSEEELKFLRNDIRLYEDSLNTTSIDYIFNDIKDKIRFTKKEIREELNINQRTFNKWLSTEFGDKYSKRKYLNIIEYIEVHKILLLGPKEADFDFRNNIKIYSDRIESGLVFSKKRLAKLTESDYLILKENINSDYYASLDKFPFRIAQQIIEQLG